MVLLKLYVHLTSSNNLITYKPVHMWKSYAMTQISLFISLLGFPGVEPWSSGYG